MSIGLYSPGSYSKVGGAKTSIRRMVELTEGKLLAVTGGEHREEEANWLVPVTRLIFERLVGLPIGLSGTRYWHFVFRWLLGHFPLFVPIIMVRAWLGKMPNLPHAKWAREDAQLIEEVKRETGCSSRIMRGLPTATAFRFFSGIPLLKGLFERRVVEVARRILEDNPDTVLQFELPAELAFTSAPLPRWWRTRIARRMTASIERIVRQLPKSSIAFHLCWGDLRNRPFVAAPFQRTANKVLLINALVSLPVWSEGWTLFAIHDPLCDGVNLPAEDQRAYRAYDDLVQFPDEGTVYALGVLHHRSDVERTEGVVRIMREKLQRAGVQHFALATPCGDGRKGVHEVEATWTTGNAVCRILDAA